MTIDINKEALKGHKDDVNKTLGTFTDEVVSIDNFVDISGNFRLRDAHSSAKGSRAKLIGRMNIETGCIDKIITTMENYDNTAIGDNTFS